MNTLLKILWCFVPALVTFGPLYMTNLGDNERSAAGAFMVAAGLIIMFIAMNKQREKIKRLEKSLEQGQPGETRGPARAAG